MGRSTPCCEKKHTTSGAWSKEEDMRLIRYIKSNGEGCWSHVPRAAGLMRCGKSCRLRWMNYLRPGLKRGNFTEEEEKLIIRLQALLGNRWAIIAARLPGRTDNEVKNYWNTYIKRKLYSKGIDPQTHQPINGIATSTTATTAPPTNTEAAVLSVVTTNNKKTDKDNSTSFSTTTITTTAPPTTNNNNTNNSRKIQLFGTESAGGEDTNSSSNSSSGVTTEEAYPELNLELSLGLPSQQEHREQKGLCFYCRLGFPANYQACSCKAKAKVTASATTVAAAPDALMPQQECA